LVFSDRVILRDLTVKQAIDIVEGRQDSDIDNDEQMEIFISPPRQVNSLVKI